MTRSNEELAIEYQLGNTGALADLWTQTERFVRLVADRMSAAGYGEPEDLAQEGFFGMRTAAGRYDPERGATFIGYAKPWIMQAMRRSDQAGGMNVAYHAQEKLWKYRKLRADFLRKYGEEPTEAEICRILDFSPATVKKVKTLDKRLDMLSIDAPAASEEDGAGTIGDTLAAAGDLAEDAIHAADHDEMAEKLRKIIDTFAGEEQLALKIRYWDEEELPPELRKHSTAAMRHLRTREHLRALRPYFDTYLEPAAYRGTLGAFRRNGGGMPEYIAIKHIEREEGRQ